MPQHFVGRVDALRAAEITRFRGRSDSNVPGPADLGVRRLSAHAQDGIRIPRSPVHNNYLRRLERLD